ncbi:MAG TPA: lytic transglycosylase domain-containing protein [Bryobacteraceae bacterium]|jgi:soluble lytic murein transglycosylase-like protein|nr:lytic transglycosylase domain-containing protein [Bryobacteraceae bacterium]
MCGFPAAVFQGADAPVVSVVRPDPNTGRLVRAVVRQRPAANPRAVPSAAMAETVDRIARENQLPSRLVHSVIQVESNYDPNAVSPKGALGLMQLIPSTARRFGVSDVFDPEDNIEGGTRYLKYLLGLYKGDESLALAAYNAGEGAVSRYGGIPPYPETVGYVAKVRQRLAGAPDETGAAPAAVQTDGAQSADAVPLYNPIREVRDANGRVYYTSQ